ncbi:hypothetical protein AVEN_51347-1, partial [Araneus ventricosus]
VKLSTHREMLWNYTGNSRRAHSKKLNIKITNGPSQPRSKRLKIAFHHPNDPLHVIPSEFFRVLLRERQWTKEKGTFGDQPGAMGKGNEAETD